MSSITTTWMCPPSSGGKQIKRVKRAVPDPEKGAVKKGWRGRIRIALVYPNTYHVGMSNLGFQTIYGRLNERDDVVCERAFLPERGSGGGVPEIRSLESEKPLSEFDIIAFSIAFENDYIHVLSILKKAGLPLRSNARGNSTPLMIAGGVTCFLNPEPMAPFFDVMVVGEAESLLSRLIDHFDPDRDRMAFLKEMAATLPGIYIPSLYHVEYHDDRTIRSFSPVGDAPERVLRVYEKDLSTFSTATAILTPDTSFSETFLIEIGRGCPHGCRFCGAGYIYRPPRFRSLPVLERSLEEGAVRSSKIGLVGAAVSDLPCLASLCDMGEKRGLTLSFSSLRAEALTETLVSALKKSGMKTATIAPDAGSERMRAVINKGITEEAILHGARALVLGGIPNLKLYFMVGLPEESEEDLLAIPDLVKKIKAVFLESSRTQKRIGVIHVSVNPFVPKPVTPFQWVRMETKPVLKQKLSRIIHELKGVPNVTVTFENPGSSILQGILSRGDRTVADLLLKIVENNGDWAKSLKGLSKEQALFALRERKVDEILPWDFIDHRVTKSYLHQEYQRALQAKETPPCDPSVCVRCGACRNNSPSFL